jgi:aryl-phospho-beta-D-glucosidase BglC (GH1 family)
MTILRWCIALLASYMLAGPVGSAGMPILSATDFQNQVYRGFTMDNASSKSMSDFDDLAAMGANLVRIGITLERCAHCKAYTIPAGRLEEVDRVVSLAQANNMYVILTMVPEAPKRAAFWDDASLQGSIIDIWSQLAERYKGTPAMGGFDLINEPNPPGRLKQAAGTYAEFAGRLIEAIRAVDPKRMIVYEPAPRGNTFYGFKALEPLPYDNILYSPHFYQPVKITHQGVGREPYGASYPTTEWNKARLSQMLEPVREFVRTYRLPVYMGEFGSVRTAPGDTTYRWIKDALELFEAEGWSWTFHAFRGYHGWDHELPADTPQPTYSAAGAGMRRANTPVMTLLRGYLKKNKTVPQ